MAQLFEIAEIGEVTFGGYALPYKASRVGHIEVKAVDAEEGVGGVSQALHEGYAQLSKGCSPKVVVGIACDHNLERGFRGVGWLPELGDGWHKAVGIALVVPIGVLVLRSPQYYARVVWQRLTPRVFTVFYAEELQVGIGGGKSLTRMEDVGR